MIDLYRRVSPGWKESFADEHYREGEEFHSFLFLDRPAESTARCYMSIRYVRTGKRMTLQGAERHCLPAEGLKLRFHQDRKGFLWLRCRNCTRLSENEHKNNRKINRKKIRLIFCAFLHIIYVIIPERMWRVCVKQRLWNLRK